MCLLQTHSDGVRGVLGAHFDPGVFIIKTDPLCSVGV